MDHLNRRHGSADSAPWAALPNDSAFSRSRGHMALGLSEKWNSGTSRWSSTEIGLSPQMRVETVAWLFHAHFLEVGAQTPSHAALGESACPTPASPSAARYYILPHSSGGSAVGRAFWPAMTPSGVISRAPARPAFQSSPHWLRLCCSAGQTLSPAPPVTGYAVRMVSDLSPEMAAWAAARRAIGTRYGEQET